jgi:hypothetical protein
MTRRPTTYEKLRSGTRTERGALALTAILPNLRIGECVIDLRGYDYDEPYGPRYVSEDDVIDKFKRREAPIVPGTDLYLVTTDPEGHEAAGRSRDWVGVKPVPHGPYFYEIDPRDYVTFGAVDPEEADYDVPYHTLDAFGCGTPHFNPWYANRDAFERESHLPV